MILRIVLVLIAIAAAVEAVGLSRRGELDQFTGIALWAGVAGCLFMAFTVPKKEKRPKPHRAPGDK